jgi:hypothetical protein
MSPVMRHPAASAGPAGSLPSAWGSSGSPPPALRSSFFGATDRRRRTSPASVDRRSPRGGRGLAEVMLTNGCMRITAVEGAAAERKSHQPYEAASTLEGAPGHESPRDVCADAGALRAAPWLWAVIRRHPSTYPPMLIRGARPEDDLGASAVSDSLTASRRS